MFSLPEYTERLRVELRHERVHNQTLKRIHLDQKEKIEELEKRNKDLEQELKRVKKENESLKSKIEKLTKTTNRYRASLFDHGNFRHPQSQNKKKKGGQKGHTNTNPDAKRDYSSYPRKRIRAEVCGKCGQTVTSVNGIKEKILLDIQINTEIIKLIVQSERQWCKVCKRRVQAIHPQSLPFTEYGINTFMVIMYLHFKGNQSLLTIATTLRNIFGLPISKSGVGNILFAAKEYLQGRYEELKQAIREGQIMYNDETGWTVRGKNAFMWIMTTPDVRHKDGTIEYGKTVYVAAESKGKGIFEEMYANSKATSMHDGNPSYVSVTGEDKTIYCWAHMIRFSYEETDKLPEKHIAVFIRDKLVHLYQAIRNHLGWTKEQKEILLRGEIAGLVSIETTDETANNILNRLKTQKEGLIRALLITEDGTNNLAEREFRQLVINRTITYGSDTYTGMETTAILSSIMQTIHRDKTKQFFPTLKDYLLTGIQEKYPQYKHTPVIIP